MTSPSDPDRDEPTSPGVDLGKGGGTPPPADEPPFDPYRFGKPDHPIPAEYAPPGYTGPTAPPANPYGTSPYGTNPYGANPYSPAPPTENPFAHPPGTPYGGPPQQYPPAEYPYGAPQPPQFHGYAQPRTGNGKAVAGLVLGICSIVFCWLSFFDAIFVILGVIFALVALSESKRPGAGGRGMAVAGLVCSLVGAVLATLLTVWIVHAANQCGGLSNSNESNWSQCVRDHL